MAVTYWQKALRDLIKASGISQHALARAAFGEPADEKESLRQRVSIHRWLHAKNHRPKPWRVIAINRSAEKLIGVEGIEAILDATAALDGLLGVDDLDLAEATLAVLDTLEAHAVFVRGWEKRLLKHGKTLDFSARLKLLASILVATWRPLIDSIIGTTPVESIGPRLRAALASHDGLSELVAPPSRLQRGIDDFLTAAREELKTPPTTSAERVFAEQRLLEAARMFCVRVAGPTKKTPDAVLGGFTPTTKGP